MANRKKYNKNAYYFDGGGSIDTSWIGAAAQGLGSAMGALGNSKFGNAYADNKIDKAIMGDSADDPLARMAKDLSGSATDQIRKDILGDRVKLDTSSNDALMKSIGNINFERRRKINPNLASGMVATMLTGNLIDFTGGPGKIKFNADGLSAGLQGASHGAVAGPWGALAGAALGTVANWTSQFTRNKKAREINRAIDVNNAYKNASINNAITNVAKNNRFNMDANYSAYGGALDYAMSSQQSNNSQLNALSNFKLNSMPNSFSNLGMQELSTFADGGTLTYRQGTPATRRQAALRSGLPFQDYSQIAFTDANQYIPPRFDNGGNLYASIPNKNQHGGEFSNGVTFINNGGMHETNPYEGVQMGIAPDGMPNLVEQGEVKYNNYIFSNRMFADKKLLKEYGLPESYKGHSFADIAEKLNKESEERPNDPISKRGLKDAMSKLAQLQERQKQEEQAKKQQEEQAIIQSMGIKGIPQQQDMQIMQEQQMLDREAQEQAMQEQMLQQQETQGLPTLGGQGMPFAYGGRLGHWHFLGDYLNNYTNTYPVLPQYDESLPVDFFVDPALNKAQKIRDDQEVLDINNSQSFSKSNTGESPIKPLNILNEDKEMPDSNKTKSKDTWMRKAPVYGAALSVLADELGLTNKPDYTNTDMIRNVANAITDVNAPHINNYLTYNPFDRNYYINKYNAEAASKRNAIINNAGGNRAMAAANLLAQDYADQQALGELYTQSELFNQAQREKVAEFNKATDMANVANDIQAAQINSQRAELRSNLLLQEALKREEIDTLAASGRSNNRNLLFENLGELGKEAYVRNMIASNKALKGYMTDDSGNAYYYLDDEQKKALGIKAKGGYLTIKKKKGRR